MNPTPLELLDKIVLCIQRWTPEAQRAYDPLKAQLGPLCRKRPQRKEGV